MCNGIYIGSTSSFAGKNTLATAFGLYLQSQEINTGYMKALGANPTDIDGIPGDEDSIFVQNMLGLNHPSELVTPVLVTQDFKFDTFNGVSRTPELEKIKKSFAKLKQSHQTMIVAGCSAMHYAKHFGLDGFVIAKELDLKVILMDRFAQGINYDLIIAYGERIGDRLLGVVLNDVPSAYMDEVVNLSTPYLEKHNIPVLGVIPSDKTLSSISAEELAPKLAGKLISTSNKPSKLMDHFLIGTMQVENFTNYFRKNPNVAVIVGGDRADVQLVAIERECPCLILTGNIYPNEIIRSRAATLGVPIIMVRQDTYSVALKMENVLAKHKLRNKSKVEHAQKITQDAIDFAAIQKAIGL